MFSSDCGSCHGARDGCCDTCDDVKDAYEALGWGYEEARFSQCIGEQKSLKINQL